MGVAGSYKMLLQGQVTRTLLCQRDHGHHLPFGGRMPCGWDEADKGGVNMSYIDLMNQKRDMTVTICTFVCILR